MIWQILTGQRKPLEDSLCMVAFGSMVVSKHKPRDSNDKLVGLRVRMCTLAYRSIRASPIPSLTLEIHFAVSLFMPQQLSMTAYLEDEHRDLLRWFVRHGGRLHPDVEMRFTPEYGFHFVATRSIGSNEVVCTCPFELSFSFLNIISQPISGGRSLEGQSACSSLLGKVDKGTSTAFFLVEQRLEGEESFWYPYMRLLPMDTDMTTPLWFSAQELLYLRGTNLCSNDVPTEQSSVGIQESIYREQWTSAVEVLRGAKYPSDWCTW